MSKLTLVEEILEHVINGASVYKRNEGHQVGPVCDCCGHTDRTLISILVVPKGCDPRIDSSQYVEGLFGTTCFNNLGLDIMDFELAGKFSNLPLEELSSRISMIENNFHVVSNKVVVSHEYTELVRELNSRK